MVSKMKRNFLKPPPPGVTEVVGKLGRGWSLAPLKNGSLLAVAGTDATMLSDDGGLSWRDEKIFHGEALRLAVLRLASGALAIYSCQAKQHWQEGTGKHQIWLSHDEGATWGPPSTIPMLGVPYYATMVQLDSGRLLYPNRTCFWGEHEETPDGHTQKPEMDIGSVSYSDDEGRTWRFCTGQLMGWFDQNGVVNGEGGVTPFDEPSLAETGDGRVLFFARSTVGRIVCSYSSDGGGSWTAVRPTELAASYSPPRLVRVPATGDLMCVWNQVSHDEIRAGYRRGRLSAAISDDSGRTWRNFRTLELSAGMADIEQVPPELPLRHIVDKPAGVSPPAGWAVFRYMNVCFAGTKVCIMYAREWLAGGPHDALLFEDAKASLRKKHEQVLRIYPLEYFY